MPQDEFIRDNIQPGDDLVVSIGGNDVVLRPSLKTIACMLMLVRSSSERIKAGRAWGLSHFVTMFRNHVTTYIKMLISKTKPKRVIVSMIYYPDEKATGGWADTALGALQYEINPEKLQTAIQEIYKRATCNIEIEGVEVIPAGIFHWLDGKTSEDYVQRVEPSSQGGEKMAKGYLDLLGDL